MSRISATLSVLSSVIVPDMISKLLSFSPDHTVLKGESRNPTRPRPEYFGWHVEYVDENTIATDEVLQKLLDRVNGLDRAIRDLRKVDNELIVRILIAITPFSPVLLFLSKEMIRAISLFDADFDIDYFE